MKTRLTILGLGVVLGLAQCTKEEEPTIALGQKIELQAQQSARVATASAPVQLTITKLTDSRCPVGVYCFQSGWADVEVELRDKAGAVQQAALCLGGCLNDSAAVVLNAEPYWLRLTAVVPYPSATARLGPQTATLYLSRQ